MSNAHHPATGAANERAKSLGDQTRRIADDVRELGSMAVAGAGEALQSVRENAQEKIQEKYEAGKDRVVRAREGFEDYVAENPFKSILIAAGIGALIGYSLRSRN